MAEVIITKENFENEILSSDKPCLVDFWATWCGPCKMIAPFIEEISEEYADTVKVCKINVDDEPELAIKYKVSSIPTVMLFKNGNVVDSIIGYRPKAAFEKLLK